MPISFPEILIVAMVCGICGCESVPHKPGIPDATGLATVKKSANLQTRNNAASLLYDLLNDEKDVDKLLIIKSVGPEVKQLVKSIASAASDEVKMLDGLAKADPGLKLDQLDLPPGEVAAREASSKTAEHELLHSSGKELDFQLLLTQSKALDYGAELAKVAAASDADPDRARQFSAIGNGLNNLCQLVLGGLRN